MKDAAAIKPLHTAVDAVPFNMVESESNTNSIAALLGSAVSCAVDSIDFGT